MNNLRQSATELLREESILEKMQTKLNLSGTVNAVTATLRERLVARSVKFKL